MSNCQCCGGNDWMTIKKFNSNGEFQWERINMQNFDGDIIFDGDNYAYIPFIRKAESDWEETYGKLRYPHRTLSLSVENSIKVPLDPREQYSGDITYDDVYEILEHGYTRIDLDSGDDIDEIVPFLFTFRTSQRASGYPASIFNEDVILSDGRNDLDFLTEDEIGEGFPIVLSNGIQSTDFAGKYMFNTFLESSSSSAGIPQTDTFDPNVTCLNASDPTEIDKYYLLHFFPEATDPNVPPADRDPFLIKFTIPSWDIFPSAEVNVLETDTALEIENKFLIHPQIDSIQVTEFLNSDGIRVKPMIMKITWVDLSIINFESIDHPINGEGYTKPAFGVYNFDGELVSSYYRSNYPVTTVSDGFGGSVIIKPNSSGWFNEGRIVTRTCEEAVKVFFISENTSNIPQTITSGGTTYYEHYYWIDCFDIDSEDQLDYSWTNGLDARAGGIFIDQGSSRVLRYNVDINDAYISVGHILLSTNGLFNSSVSCSVFSNISGGLSYSLPGSGSQRHIDVLPWLIGSSNELFLNTTSYIITSYINGDQPAESAQVNNSNLERGYTSQKFQHWDSSGFVYGQNKHLCLTEIDDSLITTVLLSTGDDIMFTSRYTTLELPTLEENMVETDCNIVWEYRVNSSFRKGSILEPPSGAGTSVSSTIMGYSFFIQENGFMTPNSRWRLIPGRTSGNPYLLSTDWMDKDISLVNYVTELISVWGIDDLHQEPNAYPFLDSGPIYSPGDIIPTIEWYSRSDFNYIPFFYASSIQSYVDMQYEQDNRLLHGTSRQTFNSDSADVIWTRWGHLTRPRSDVGGLDFRDGNIVHIDKNDNFYITYDAPFRDIDSLGNLGFLSPFAVAGTLNGSGDIYGN